MSEFLVLYVILSLLAMAGLALAAAVAWLLGLSERAGGLLAYALLVGFLPLVAVWALAQRFRRE